MMARAANTTAYVRHAMTFTSRAADISGYQALALRQRSLPPRAPRAAGGGRGGGGVGAACAELAAFEVITESEQAQPPTPRCAASLRRSTLPANGREGSSGEFVLYSRLRRNHSAAGDHPGAHGVQCQPRTSGMSSPCSLT